MIEKISKAEENNTIAANVVFHTTGIMISSENIAYLSGLCYDLEKNDKIKNKIPQKKLLIILRIFFLIIWCYTMKEKKSAHLSMSK